MPSPVKMKRYANRFRLPLKRMLFIIAHTYMIARPVVLFLLFACLLCPVMILLFNLLACLLYMCWGKRAIVWHVLIFGRNACYWSVLRSHWVIAGNRYIVFAPWLLALRGNCLGCGELIGAKACLFPVVCSLGEFLGVIIVYG